MVAVDEKLVEAFRVAGIRRAIQGNFDRGAATAGRRRVVVPQDPPSAQQYLVGTDDLHDRHFLAHPP